MKAQKPGLHPRNRHHQRYDLPALCQAHPDLQGYITLNPLGEQTIDFANPQAVKALNKALLAHFYAVKHWDIPDGFLCPPVPGRADYIHHLADLLAQDSGEVPKQATILDIGTGANLIYPLIGVHEYGWRFTGSEISPEAFASAQAIVNGNPGLTRQIRLRRQKRARPSSTASSTKTRPMTPRCVIRRSMTPQRAPGRAVSASAAISDSAPTARLTLAVSSRSCGAKEAKWPLSRR